MAHYSVLSAVVSYSILLFPWVFIGLNMDSKFKAVQISFSCNSSIFWFESPDFVESTRWILRSLFWFSFCRVRCMRFTVRGSATPHPIWPSSRFFISLRKGVHGGWWCQRRWGQYGCSMMQYICRRWSSLFDIGCDLKHYRFRWMILAHPHPSLTRVRICGVYGSILTKANRLGVGHAWW